MAKVSGVVLGNISITSNFVNEIFHKLAEQIQHVLVVSGILCLFDATIYLRHNTSPENL